MSSVNIEPTDEKWRKEQFRKIMKFVGENKYIYEESTDGIKIIVPLFKPVPLSDLMRPVKKGEYDKASHLLN